MKRKIQAVFIIILLHQMSIAQLKKSACDTLVTVNTLLSELPNSRRMNNYVKYKIEYKEESNEAKLYCLYFDIKTEAQANQNNISVFKWSDVDPNAIVIRAYDSKRIMLQLITKGNGLNVHSLFTIDEDVVGDTKLDRISIDSYEPDMKTKLERLRNAFIYVVKSVQENPLQKYGTDTTDIKTIVQSSKEGSSKVDLTEMRKGESYYVFGTIENSPTFLNSSSTKDTELKVHSYLSEMAKKEKPQVKGKIFVEFVIDRFGHATNIKILRGLSKQADSIAVKVIKNMPLWTPGIINGQPIDTKFTTNIELN